MISFILQTCDMSLPAQLFCGIGEKYKAVFAGVGIMFGFNDVSRVEFFSFLSFFCFGLYFCHILAWLHNNCYFRMFVCWATSTLSVHMELSYVLLYFVWPGFDCLSISSGPALTYTPPTTSGGDIMTFWCFSQATFFCSCRLMTSWEKRKNGMVVTFGTELIRLSLAPLYALACTDIWFLTLSSFFRTFFLFFFSFLFFVVGSFGGELETISNDPSIDWDPYIECRIYVTLHCLQKMW